MISTDKIKGHLAAIAANVFFGINVPITKDLISNGLTPTEYIITRVGVATVLFWLIGCFVSTENVCRKDITLFGIGGLFGVVGAQYLVGISLEYTSPIYFSLMSALSPVIVMLLASIFLHESITKHKAAGVFIGIAGAAILILNDASSDGNNNLSGIMMALFSVTSYALYLIIIRSVTYRYTPLVQMKWTYLSACIFLLPMTILELPAQEQIIKPSVPMIGELAFIIIFSTVISFILVPYSLKFLRPTTVSVYINLQPVVASFAAVILRQDLFTWEKPIAGLFVLIGAYIVTTSPVKPPISRSITII